MSRLDKIDALIAAVKADADKMDVLRAALMFGHRYVYVVDAYNGSLDAAKALHEALLPGWTRDVDASAPECGITVTLHRPYSGHSYPEVEKAVSGELQCEARAWLLAILRAYRMTQEAGQ